LIAAVERMGEASSVIDKRARYLAMPATDRVDRSLGKAEREARSRIETAQRSSEPSRQKLKDAETEASKRNAANVDLRRRIDALWTERRALIDEAEASLWARWLHRERRESRLSQIGQQIEILEARARITEQYALNSGAAHARTEREFEKACSEHRQAVAKETRSATVEVDRLTYMHRLLTIWPDLAFCGPVFYQRVGERLWKARQHLRNPQAVNIWGLPIAGPGGG
jgi:hypothetical protein